MGKGSSAPRPPSAGQQSAANTETAIANQRLNLINQRGPYGSITYNQTGTTRIGGQDVPNFEQVTTLSPAQQAQYNQLLGIQSGALGLGGQAIQRAGQALGQQFNYQGLPAQVTNIQGGPLNNSVSVGGPQIQRQLSFAGQPGLPGVGDFSGDRQRVEDSLYQRQTRQLDPQFQQRRAALETQLANQGVARGSKAFQNAIGDFERSQADAYSQARNESLLGGGQEQSRLFGLGLTARQQGVQEALSQGQFGNQAQQQAYQQALQNATFGNQAAGQAFQQAQANAALANQGRQQGIQERAYQRSQPLNELAQLLGFGGQIQGPQFNPVPQSNIQGTDLFQAYNANLNRYNQGQQQQQATLGGLFGLGGAALGALPFL